MCNMLLNITSMQFLMCLTIIITWIHAVTPYNVNRDSRVRAEFENYRPLIKTNNECHCTCGRNNRQMRIVGGNVTKAHEFPWMVSISRGGKLTCGAVLITRRHLLTAAHCIEGYDLEGFDISLGQHFVETSSAEDDDEDEYVRKVRFHSTLERKLKSAHTHFDFNVFTFNNDIAVLELDTPVEFDETIQPVCLPSNVDTNYTSRLGLVTGWGRTDEMDKPSNLLRKVNVPIWSRQQCLDSGYARKKITENMMCAGYHDGKKDACQGDSGGPMHLVADDGSLQVIGVVSWGRGCARPNYPGVYTKVANYLDWLHKIIDDECLCPSISS